MRWALKVFSRSPSAWTSCSRWWSVFAGPGDERTRRSARLGGFIPAADSGGDREILGTDLLRLEGAHALRHAGERLRDRHRWTGTLLRGDPANGIAACDHDRAQVGALHPHLLQRLHVRAHTVVDVQQAHRPLLALTQRRR